MFIALVHTVDRYNGFTLSSVQVHNVDTFLQAGSQRRAESLIYEVDLSNPLVTGSLGFPMLLVIRSFRMRYLFSY